MRHAVVAIALLAPLAAAARARLPVYVSVAPQAYLVEQIGGELVKVRVLVPPGRSPHTYEPLPRQLAALASSRALFRVGVPFETGLMEKIRGSHHGLRIVDTREGVRLLGLDGEDDHLHQHRHGPGDHHREMASEADPHIWLDPQRVKVQARTVASALGQIDPLKRETYDMNLAKLIAEFEALDRRIAERLAPFRGQAFMVYHPAFGYFADRYGLKQVAVEIEGKQPGARHVAELIRKARAEKIRVIFVQTGFSRTSAEVIAQEIGGVVRELDPLHRDIIENLEAMAAAIEEALKR